jgi:hypothetical protein
MPQSFFGTTQLSLDMLHVKTANILEFNSFEQIPDAFLRIQFWRIRRQTFKMNPLGTAFCQKIFDRLTTMNGRSIPDDQQVAGNLTSEQLQKAYDIWTFVRMLLRLHKDPALRGDATHGRKMVTRQLDAQGGRLAYRRIGANGHGQEVKGGLIDKNYRPLFLLGLFLRAGHRSSFQAAMAVSSRWVAFWMGFCRLCLRRRRRRLA